MSATGYFKVSAPRIGPTDAIFTFVGHDKASVAKAFADACGVHRRCFGVAQGLAVLSVWGEVCQGAWSSVPKVGGEPIDVDLH